MDSTSKNEFIGRYGSRKVPVDRLVNFLEDAHKQGFFQIFGCWEIGKSEIIEKAISEISERKWPKIKKIKCFLRHPLTIETFKEAVEELTKKKIKFRSIKSRFEEKNKIDTILNRANSFIENECKRYEVALILYQSNEIDYSYVEPSNLFLLPRVSHNPATRKVITEQRINTEVDWRNGKPDLYDEILIKCLDESDVDEEDEVRTFISQKIHNKIDSDSTLFNNVVYAIRKFSGQHPGLLKCICKYLNDANIEFSEQSTESCLNSIKELLPAREKSIIRKIDKLLASLSNEAVEKIRCNESHSELKYNGLLTKDEAGMQRLILLLELFCKNQRNDSTGSLVISDTTEKPSAEKFKKSYRKKIPDNEEDSKMGNLKKWVEEQVGLDKNISESSIWKYMLYKYKGWFSKLLENEDSSVTLDEIIDKTAPTIRSLLKKQNFITIDDIKAIGFNLFGIDISEEVGGKRTDMIDHIIKEARSGGKWSQLFEQLGKYGNKNILK